MSRVSKRERAKAKRQRKRALGLKRRDLGALGSGHLTSTQAYGLGGMRKIARNSRIDHATVADVARSLRRDAFLESVGRAVRTGTRP